MPGWTEARGRAGVDSCDAGCGCSWIVLGMAHAGRPPQTVATSAPLRSGRMTYSPTPPGRAVFRGRGVQGGEVGGVPPASRESYAPCATYYAPPTMHHPPCTIYRLPPTVYLLPHSVPPPCTQTLPLICVAHRLTLDNQTRCGCRVYEMSLPP